MSLKHQKQSRLRAWRLGVAIPPAAQKKFDAEGEALEHALQEDFPKDTFICTLFRRCGKL
jgi:hypothetical protein